jgi:cytochrome b6-f complex iron-sulfur subunit
MADKKKLSVAEILAAARKLDGGAAGDAEQPPSADPAAGSQPPPAESTPLSTSAAPKTKPGERPSVAEMLAIARGETQAAAKPPPADESVTEKKPAAKAAAKKTTKKSAGSPSPAAERMDTASILAAARTDSKRGPVSKSEAPELLERKTPAAAPTLKPDAPQMPERPAYAVPPPKPETDEGRRFVLVAALFGSSFATGMTLLGTTLVVWTLALARFMFPNVLTEPPSQFKVGFPEDFAPGQVETKFKAQFGIWLVNAHYQEEPCIFALSTVCTHLGCTPNWLESEQKFKCPCHGSGFYKDGINFEGPAPRPLERYAIRVSGDGQVEVDKSRKFQEEMGQWLDPASFVPV